jgi:hypothetical protein
MSTVLKPERIRADEVRVGDKLSRTKTGEYQEVIATIQSEKAVWIHLSYEVDGRPVGMHRIRPRHDIKLWVLR